MMEVPAAPKDVNFDDFEKDPNGALRNIDEQTVRVVRDGGKGDLVVTTEDRLVRQIEALRSASRAIRHRIEGASAHDALASEFPWASVLPEGDAEIFYAEILSAVDTENVERSIDTLQVLLDQWCATADAWADPDVIEALTTPIEDHGPVII